VDSATTLVIHAHTHVSSFTIAQIFHFPSVYKLQSFLDMCIVM